MKHFLGKYHAYGNGVIINRNTGRELKPQDNGNGYKKVTLTHEGQQIQKYVHRIIAELFVSNPRKLNQINHKDGDKSNNDKSNLEWVSNSENQIHAHKIGLKKHGNELWNGKFSAGEIKEIFFLYNSGVKQYAIAKMKSVSRSTICEILSGKRYKYTTMEELTLKQ